MLVYVDWVDWYTIYRVYRYTVYNSHDPWYTVYVYHNFSSYTNTLLFFSFLFFSLLLITYIITHFRIGKNEHFRTFNKSHRPMALLGQEKQKTNGSIHFFPIGLGSSQISPNLKSLPEMADFLNHRGVFNFCLFFFFIFIPQLENY